MALQLLNPNQYWNCIGTLTSSEELAAKTLGLNSMAKRIAVEGA